MRSTTNDPEEVPMNAYFAEALVVAVLLMGAGALVFAPVWLTVRGDG